MVRLLKYLNAQFFTGREISEACASVKHGKHWRDRELRRSPVFIGGLRPYSVSADQAEPEVHVLHRDPCNIFCVSSIFLQIVPSENHHTHFVIICHVEREHFLLYHTL
jgi:hypothetical protein